MTTSRGTTGRGSPPGGAGTPRSGRKPLLRLPSRLALTGIRTRILLGFIVMLAIATAASLFVAYEVVQTRLHERIDSDLAREAEELRKIAAGKDPATGRSFGQNAARIFRVYFDQTSPTTGEVALTFVDGSEFLRSRSVSASSSPSYRLDTDEQLVSHWKALTEPERDGVDTPAGRVEYLALPLKGDGRVLGTFVVAAFTDVLQGPYNDAFLAAGVVGVAVLLIGSLLAWRMAESVLQPVSALTQTAQGISETDLTQRIEVRGHDELAGLAATLNAMLDRLERTLLSQRRFLDDAGHELRTPITIVRGHLELLEDDPEERRATLDLVMDELDRMTRMVNDLILLSKAERPDFLKLEAVEVAVLTDEVLTKARALGARGWRLDACGKGVITVDRQRLTQALVQLAQNAVTYTQEGDEVSLGSAVEGGEARFWVRDDGLGIAVADQERIFERFERGGARGPSGGSGLGLSIVRAIAGAHGGRVDLFSAPGAGSLFTIVVPVDGPRGTGKEEG